MADSRANTRSLALAILVATGLAGCAGAKVLRAEAPDPEAPTLLVQCLVDGLAHRADILRVEAEWAGYTGSASVPVVGGPQPERLTVPIERWTFEGRSRLPLTLMEVRFYLGRKVLHRLRMRTPFSEPGVLTRDPTPAPQEEGSGRRLDRPEPVVADRGDWAPARTPARSAPARDFSRDRDDPTRVHYPDEIVCRLDAGSGPRYVRLDGMPEGLLEVVVDVDSHGPPSLREVTTWRIELLDEDGLALGTHVEEGFVDMGGQSRSIKEWRFDGSNMILMLRTGSEAGDTLRVRFRRTER